MTNLSQIFGEYNHTTIRWNEDPTFPIWVAKDICDALEIKNNRDALSSLDQDEKGVVATDTPGGNQEMAGVTEAGLYRLIFKSRKKGAKDFQRWVFHDVLPSIRKTGSYSLDQQPEPLPRLGNQELLDYVDKVMETSTTFAEYQPRLAQELTDVLMNRLKPEQKELPSNEPLYRGAVEIALDMGYSKASDSSIRVKLGKFLQKRLSPLAKKENRLCNGVSRPINCYPDTPEVREMITLFFED